MQDSLCSCRIHSMCHGREKGEKLSRSSVLLWIKCNQYTVKDLDNKIQFLCLIKTLQQPQNVAKTQLKICDYACY